VAVWRVARTRHTDPSIPQDIQLEISHASNTTLCCTDFDATSCYDQIIPVSQVLQALDKTSPFGLATLLARVRSIVDDEKLTTCVTLATVQGFGQKRSLGVSTQRELSFGTNGVLIRRV
jgi:hypothetical protein